MKDRGDGRKDAALTLRRWMAISAAALDPQAYILTPEAFIALAQKIVDSDTPYHAGKAVALEAELTIYMRRAELPYSIH